MKLFLTLLCCLSINLLLAQTQVGADIDGENAYDNSGHSVSMSEDGNRLAIGAAYNDGNGTSSGHTRIFEWTNNQWTQLGQDIDGENQADNSGYALSISADGNRVAIGAANNDGNASNAGHVRIFEWDGINWIQLGEDIDGENTNDHAGQVSISGDGNRVAIGAYEHDFNGANSGQVRIFEWNNNSWTQLGQNFYGENSSDFLGNSCALSENGNRVVIGSSGHNGFRGQTKIYQWNNNNWIQIGQNINGEDPGDSSGIAVSISSDGNRVAISTLNSNNSKGHVGIFEWNNNEWTQLGDDIEGEIENDFFAFKISISSDGNQVAVGALSNDENGISAGLVKIFKWFNNEWIHLNPDKLGENAGDNSGVAVSLSGDGKRVAIGADKNDGSGTDAGHVRVYAISKPNITSNDICFTLDYNPQETQYILEGDFTNCNIFVLDENENVVQFLLNINDKIVIELDDLPAGLHFIRVEHQQHDDLFIQEIIKQ